MKNLKLAVLNTLLAFMSFHGTAQPKVESVEKQNMEVISVTGQLPLTHFRDQMFSAEESFYDLYNSQTDNSDYKIICSMDIQSNSYIRKRNCEPQYIKLARSELTAESVANGQFGRINYTELEVRLISIKTKANTHMAKRVEADPKLKEKLYSYYQAKKTYEQKIAERFPKD